jgi:anti-sigma B factor antagonist
MKLEIRQREKEGILILELKGTLTAGEAATHLRDNLRGQVEQNRGNVVLDLAGVDYIDSTGLGSMVVCFTSARKAGGKLALLNLNRRNVELLVLTKLSTVFEIFDDEQQAVNSFFPEREIKRFDILSFVARKSD